MMFLPGTDSRLACPHIKFIILLFSGIQNLVVNVDVTILKLIWLFSLQWSFLLCVVFCSFIMVSVGVDFFLLVLLGVCWDFWNLWIDIFHQFWEILNWLSRLANIPITKAPSCLGPSLWIFFFSWILVWSFITLSALSYL